MCKHIPNSFSLLQKRILDILNLPLVQRCPELGLIIDRASVKELQEVFPLLVNSIFGGHGSAGGVGWGFRTVTQISHPYEFEILYNFFIPLGPMFRLLYRLLSDTVKYEVPISFLPPKMQQMLEAGRYSSFYSDIINIDPFRRQVVSLSLNAFDYYFIHFVTHGTLPLHKMYAQSVTANSDKARTVYFFLTADYLCTFLPSSPDTVIQPQNICSVIKIASPTAPAPQPIRRPKYLLPTVLSMHTAAQNPPQSRQLDSSRASIWRSETVLILFIDAWLRCDYDESRDLPSNEFIRVVRVLVKQIHGFGNSAELDNTSLAALRHVAQPLMSSKMFAFLKSLLSRWPLDSSFTDVLELWLSFIQPWRYTFNRDLNTIAEMPIPQKYEKFIGENLICYTQIFIKLLPRFERLDLSTLKNVFMLFRMLKVFCQSNLTDYLRRHELSLPLAGNITLLDVSSSFYKEASPVRSPGSSHGSAGNSPDWRPFSRSDGNLMFQDTYVALFAGDSHVNIEDLARKVMVCRVIAQRNLDSITNEHQQKYRGFLGLLKSIFFSDEDQAFNTILEDKKKIPKLLEFCAQGFAIMFNVQIPEPQLNEELIQNYGEDNSYDSVDHRINSSQLSDGSMTISPASMRNNLKNIKYSGDPALIPINDTKEITTLVRFLHQVSSKLNLMFNNEIDQYWNRTDFKGRLARHLLLPPMVAQSFDKSTGISELKSTELPPRICLRPLGSYKSVCMVIASLLLGYFLWSAPSYGLFLLLLLVAIQFCIKALVQDVTIEQLQ